MPDKVLTLNPYTGGVFDGNNSWVELEEPASEADANAAEGGEGGGSDPADPVDNVPGE